MQPNHEPSLLDRRLNLSQILIWDLKHDAKHKSSLRKSCGFDLSSLLPNYTYITLIFTNFTEKRPNITTYQLKSWHSSLSLILRIGRHSINPVYISYGDMSCVSHLA